MTLITAVTRLTDGTNLGGSSSRTGVGQAFRNGPRAAELDELHFFLRRTLATLPEGGQLVARLYSMLGTYSIDARPDPTDLLATSDVVDVDTISVSFEEGAGGFTIIDNPAEFLGTVFTFTGAERYQMVPRGYYVGTVEVETPLDNGSLIHGFNLAENPHPGVLTWRNTAGFWQAPIGVATQDCNIQVHATPVPGPPYRPPGRRGADLPRRVGCESFEGVDGRTRNALRRIFNSVDQNLRDAAVRIDRWLKGS